MKQIISEVNNKTVQATENNAKQSSEFCSFFSQIACVFLTNLSVKSTESLIIIPQFTESKFNQKSIPRIRKISQKFLLNHH